MANKSQINLTYIPGFGANYANLRKKDYNHKQDYTIRELAKLLNISYPTISNIEKEKRTPTVEQVYLYKNYFKEHCNLEISLDYLTGESTCLQLAMSDICKTLGLTEEAAKAIISLRSNEESKMNIMDIIAEFANEIKEENEEDNKSIEKIEKTLTTEHQIFNDNILSKLLASEYFNEIVFYCTTISKNARELIELYEQNHYLVGEIQKIAKLEKELKLSQYEAATIFQKIISIFDEHENLEALRKDNEEHIKISLNNVINADNAFPTEQA